MERIFHTVCFEGIAIATLAPATAWLMQRSVLRMGGLTILLATTAMIRNIIYNALFDRLWPSHLVKHTAKVRASHTLGLESSPVVIGVGIMAYMLSVSLVQASTLGIGFLPFFLPHTIFYNWVYDTSCKCVMKRHQQCVTV